ncbi:hypothetical protein ACEPAF_8606 [Sanghuangporus sanghuang]
MGNQKLPSVSKTSAKQPVVHRGRSASLPLPARKPRRVALLIGCRYKGNECHDELRQTHKDVLRLRKLFIDVYHYNDMDVIVLLDDGEHVAPTKENILKEMKKLVAGAKAGDSFFFYFAGHGVQTPCETEDETETDGMDEAIVPCDATEDKNTWIIDNDMNKLLVRKIPVNAQLIAFFDMCHSGTAMDLNHYCYNEEGSVHAFKRSSHGTVENESRKINELPPQDVAVPGQYASTSKATQRSSTRRFSYKKRTSTIRSELSGGSDGGALRLAASVIEHSKAPEPVKPKPHREYSCADCGGFLDEGDLPDDLAAVLVHEQNENQQGFIPDRPAESPVDMLRPAPERKTARLPSLDASSPAQEQCDTGAASAVARRHSYASPRETQFGCLSTLRLNWLPVFLKRKFGIAGKGASSEKTNESARHDARSRTSTINSLTPFFSTAPVSRPVSASASTTVSPMAQAATPILQTPKPIKNLFKRNSTPVAQVPVLGDIQEDEPVSSFHDGDIPRCMSPLQYTASGPVSPINIAAPETPSSTAGVAFRGPRRLTRNVGAEVKQKKCNCRASSGVQEHGQVITIGGCSDAQLAWETKRGTLTSALIEILEKDAHPTYESLIASLQAFLNGMSDELRQHVAWTKRHLRFKKVKRDAKGQGQQRQAKPKPRSNSVSTPGGSHKSGDDIGADVLNAFDQVLEEAQGGPVQTATIGTQNYMDLAKVRFNPRGSLPTESAPLASHHVEHHL